MGDARKPDHQVRISHELWEKAQRKADVDHDKVARIVRRALEDYVGDRWSPYR